MSSTVQCVIILLEKQFYTVSLLIKKIDMKKMKRIAAMLLVVVTTTSAFAQEMPQPSPKAKVEQRIGLTDVTVEYSRPSVKGRKIFGNIVPYNVIWRTGANMNTLITFNDKVKVEGKDLAAGTYSVFTIPAKDDAKWTVMFNSVVDGWGEGKYVKTNDVLTVSVDPKMISKQESMLFSFDNLSDKSGDLILSWDKVAISVTIEVEVEEKAWKNIKLALADATEKTKPNILRNAAKYTVTTGKRLQEGKKWIIESIKLNESWYSYWVKADVQHAIGDNEGAVVSLENAIELGVAGAKETGKEFGYKEKLEKVMSEYK
jgi:hypothetical protein